jgi:hypothetical protein
MASHPNITIKVFTAVGFSIPIYEYYLNFRMVSSEGADFDRIA